MFNWMLGQLRKSCEKIVCSWKSSGLESTESCEKAPRPQPNSVFAQFSVVCMFNWMLGQLRRVVGRSYVRGRAPNLNRLSSVREKLRKDNLTKIVRSDYILVNYLDMLHGSCCLTRSLNLMIIAVILI